MYVPSQLRDQGTSLAALYNRGVRVMSLAWLSLLVFGCGMAANQQRTPGGAYAQTGRVYGGQQPVAGAAVQLYAVSTSGDGMAATPLINSTVLTEASGSFSITGTYTCPSASDLVYLVATGGNPGLGVGVQNNAASLMAAIGACGSLTPSTYISVHEVTTVGAVWSLAPFMTSYHAIGSANNDADQLRAAFDIASELVNTATGTAPRATAPEGATLPTTVIHALADTLSACISSSGASSGACATLFSIAESINRVLPANTVDALLQIVKSPTTDVAGVFAIAPPNAPFQTSLSSAPIAWFVAFTPTAPSTTSTFTLSGLTSPATVAETIFVQAAGLPVGANVSYYFDDELTTETSSAPYWMGGQSSNEPYGLSVDGLTTGSHTLRAVAIMPDGTLAASNAVTLNVIKSINEKLSTTLAPYANQLSAQQNSVSSILQNISTPGAVLSPQELATRQNIATMYMNWGIDPSLDYANDESTVLADRVPTGWAPAATVTSTTPLSMQFSTDAPYYQTIPSIWPRVALPSLYINNVQLNTAPDGDGIGYGETVASSSNGDLPVRSEWYSIAATLDVFDYRMSPNWSTTIPMNAAGDEHVIFVDPTTNTFISSYKTSVDPTTAGPDSLYASNPTPLGTLGAAGGSTASKFAELPVLLQPGEATNLSQPIRHALGGPVRRTWAARVFPASGRDANVLTSTNTCTGMGFTNTGLVPYGGVLQLDPALNLATLHVSLPALRILQAIQTYGYYVMDFGCADLDIYTAISGAELDPYGGLWGNANGPGVQNEVQRVLTTNTLYVVVPLTKKQ